MATLNDRAGIHEHQLLADLAGEGKLVRHDHHCHAGARQVAHDGKHVAHQLRIECGSRLVEQHQLRLHRQCPGNRDTLLLAAGKLRRIAPMLVGKPYASKQFHRALPCLRERYPFHPDRRLDNVLQGGHMREQIEVLEHHADALAHPRHLPFRQFVEAAAVPPTHSRPPSIRSR